MRAFVDQAVSNPVYVGAMIFLGGYPIVSALAWIGGSVVFASDLEARDRTSSDSIDPEPFVSVLIPAHNEEAVIEETLERVLELDWSRFEVMVVDDGSTDRTRQIVERHVAAGTVRLLKKRKNEGKALALDDALPLLKGGIVLILDADGRPEPNVLRLMVPHFTRSPRVAAVTGNPRVVNTTTLLAKLQAIEFSATVSVLRRAQAVWGRLMTFSGICTALRKSAIEEVGSFRPEMATEDIALTWQLERDHFDVVYEPRAVFAMQVPERLTAWWSQRTRWARGLGQVLRRNIRILRSWRARRLWPIYLEAGLSLLWSNLLLIGVVLWALAFSTGVYHFAADPLPDFWGVLIACVGLAQILLGLALDRRHDPTIQRYVLWAPIYPLVYWGLGALAAVRAGVPGFVRKPAGAVTWSVPRYSEQGRAK